MTRLSSITEYRLHFVFVTAALLLALAAIGCDSQGKQDEFADQASRLPEGFTETTLDAEIVTTDPDDWRTSPFYRGRITVDPAFPNPVSINFVNIPLTVIGFDAVQGGGLSLRAYGADGRTLISLAEPISVSGPGGYEFEFSPGLLSTKGLHRVYIFDLGGEIVSYGDVMVQ